MEGSASPDLTGRSIGSADVQNRNKTDCVDKTPRLFFSFFSQVGDTHADGRRQWSSFWRPIARGRVAIARRPLTYYVQYVQYVFM